MSQFSGRYRFPNVRVEHEDNRMFLGQNSQLSAKGPKYVEPWCESSSLTCVPCSGSDLSIHVTRHQDNSQFYYPNLDPVSPRRPTFEWSTSARFPKKREEPPHIPISPRAPKPSSMSFNQSMNSNSTYSFQNPKAANCPVRGRRTISKSHLPPKADKVPIGKDPSSYEYAAAMIRASSLKVKHLNRHIPFLDQLLETETPQDTLAVVDASGAVGGVAQTSCNSVSVAGEVVQGHPYSSNSTCSSEDHAEGEAVNTHNPVHADPNSIHFDEPHIIHNSQFVSTKDTHASHISNQVAADVNRYSDGHPVVPVDVVAMDTPIEQGSAVMNESSEAVLGPLLVSDESVRDVTDVEVQSAGSAVTTGASEEPTDSLIVSPIGYVAVGTPQLHIRTDLPEWEGSSV